MAPFNHFGTDFTNPLPPISPPSTKRGAREARTLRGFLKERTPNTSRNSKSRRASRKFGRSAQNSPDAGALADSESEDTDGVDSGSDSDDASEPKVPEPKERGILGDAIAGVGDVVDSALDPILGDQSSTTAVDAPETTTAVEVESTPIAVATTASEPSEAAITSSEKSSATAAAAAAAVTSRPSIIFTTPTPHSSKVPDAPSPSDAPVVGLSETSDVLSPLAAAAPTPSSVAAALTRFTPEVTRTSPTPTAQLQSADRASLGNSQATGAAGQKAQGLDSTVKPNSDVDSDSDSDGGIESGDESGDESDNEKDDPTESRLVAFTTISGTPLSTLSAVLDPTGVRNLPSSVTPVSQTGGQTTIASASASKPPLTPEASNGLIAFGAVGKDSVIKSMTQANMS